MSLSTGQINSTFQSTLGRDPTGSELSQYTSRGDLEGGAGQSALAGELKGGGGSLSTPSSPGDVGSYLKTYQNAISQAQQTLNTPQQSPQEIVNGIKQQLLPSQPIPTAPDLVGEYNQLKLDQGTQPLEASLAALKSQENDINTQLEAQTNAEQDKTVPLNVIAGRQTEEQRQVQVHLDSIARQKQAVTEELTMRYSAIDTIMKYTQQNYDNALKFYDMQFQQNTAVYQAFNQEEQFQYQQRQDAAKTILDATDKMASLDMQIQQQQKQSASANLQIYANMITSGNTKYADMSPDQKLSIQKLEVQSGLGVGFVESLTNGNPNGKVIYAGANGAVMQMQDGSLKTVNYNVSASANNGNNPKPGSPAALSSAIGEMSSILAGVANSYGNITPAQWKAAQTNWTQQGFKAADFSANFSHFADPNRGDFTTAYPTAKAPAKPKAATAPIPGFTNK